VQEGRPPAHFFELKPAHFFEKRAGPNLHTFGVNCAGFAQKCAEKPAHFFEGQCALRPWNHWVFGVPAHFRAFFLFLYYSEEEKKSNNAERMLAEKTRDKSVQRPDTCTLLERNENMSRYELNIYEEPIYVYELDRIFANPDEPASFLNVDTHDIIRTLMLNTTIRDLHISENRRLRRTRWRPIRIVETGEIFPSAKHLAYRMNVTQQDIAYAMRTWDHHFRSVHLEYVEE
jgi:hypothetical protein